MPEHAVTHDLIDKAADDVLAALKRTLAVAPEPCLPIAISAGAACLGVAAAQLERLNKNRIPRTEPDKECILLAALLMARTGVESGNPIEEAYADLKALKDAGRPCFETAE